MRSSLAVVSGIACFVVAGCAQPIHVRVVDSQSGKPIPGASVERWDVLRPYFIVGTIAPVERREADALGEAELKGRRGSLRAAAPGYESRRAGFDAKEKQVVIELTPTGVEQAVTD